MIITEAWLTKGAAHGRTGQSMVPQGIVVHYVANPGSTAQANRNWFENGAGGARTSAHYIVGLAGEVLQLVPDTERAMHAGKSYGTAWNQMAPTNNARYIGIECCHPDATGKFNTKTMESLLTLLRRLCTVHKLDPARDIRRHYDVTGKNCPAYYVKYPDAWQALVDACKQAPAGVTVNLNGTPRTINARIEADRLYITLAELAALIPGDVPLRAVCEAAGCQVTFKDGLVHIKTA